MTLEAILHHLETRKSLPNSNNNIKTATTSAVKLVGFTNKTPQSYLVLLKRKSHQTLRATVTLDWTKYPVVPPRWKFQEAQQDWGKEYGGCGGTEAAPLHDATLQHLQQSMCNNNLLSSNYNNNNDDSSLFFLLVHQLRHLMNVWDQFMQQQEEQDQGGNSSAAANDSVAFAIKKHLKHG
mmetsp:Transcript_31811/g.48687  ORF Transcript_31811/g.48687 Transcript_31811/m.48687 type:complete len:180 (-) Transcript_31811:38-577(-)